MLPGAMIDKEKVESILSRMRTVEGLLADPQVASDQKKYREIVREHAALGKLQERAGAYYSLMDRIEEDRAMLGDEAQDPELRQMAQDDLAEAEGALPAAEKALAEARAESAEWLRQACFGEEGHAR